MKTLFSFILLFISFSVFCQHKFKPGYYIDESGQKNVVLIKDEGWKNNPDKFYFKSTDDSPEQTARLENVKEFSINQGVKYIRATVQLDQSSLEIARLSRDPNPDYIESTVFLELLVAGEANLYYHQGKTLKNFFYNKNGGAIEPLIYKKYISQLQDNSSQSIKENRAYQNQLVKNINCEGMTSRPRNIFYTAKDLVSYFNDYNYCNGSMERPGNISQITPFHLRIRPGINKSGLELNSSQGHATFEDKYNFRLGLEAELILPFNNQKWGLILEPTYQSYTATSYYRDLEVTIYYKSIELPLGIRHYFYLNDSSAFFMNASYLLDFNFGNSRFDMTTFSDMAVATVNGNLALGAGYSFKKLSGEIRYYTGRDLLANGEDARTADYKTISLILGYKIF